LAQLENIKNNSKNYQKIERIAEQKANDILNNRKAVVLAAVIAVLEALRNHVDNLLITNCQQFRHTAKSNGTD
jgi:rRNA-processing protein FCF1